MIHTGCLVLGESNEDQIRLQIGDMNKINFICEVLNVNSVGPQTELRNKFYFLYSILLYMSVNITLLFLVMVRVWEKNFSFAQTKTNGRLYYIDLNLMANTRNPFRFSDNPLKTFWWSVEYSVHKKNQMSWLPSNNRHRI